MAQRTRRMAGGKAAAAVVAASILAFSLAVCIGARQLPHDNGVHNILTGGGEAGTQTGGEGHPQIELISWEPRAFLYHNFLSDEEADYLREHARPSMHKSQVVDSNTGGSMDSDIRTSEGAWLGRGSDPVIDRIEQRIAAWTHIPASHGEDIHVLHYAEGQKYDPHYDAFFDNVNTQNGGNRYATVLMYLASTEMGGETTFPQADHFDPAAIDNTDKSECATDKLSVKPRKGDAILFYDLYVNGELDRHSLHGACPVVKGEKWAATKWMHVNPFQSLLETQIQRRYEAVGNACADIDDSCAKWAALGECEKNPGFMIGYAGKLGRCRATCRACSSVQIPLRR